MEFPVNELLEHILNEVDQDFLTTEKNIVRNENMNLQKMKTQEYVTGKKSKNSKPQEKTYYPSSKMPFLQ